MKSTLIINFLKRNKPSYMISNLKAKDPILEINDGLKMMKLICRKLGFYLSSNFSHAHPYGNYMKVPIIRVA